ncbi:MAG TPA: TRAP transporter small permease [Bacteroidales bacterium]|nr:TRAP transporter small permease [Bacteroidales bacterium]
MKKISYILNHLEEYILAFLMTIMVTVLAVQVFSRYVLSFSFSWAEQFARICFVWLTMVGISLAAREKMHLKIELLQNILPPKWISKVNFFSSIYTAVFSLFLGYLIIKIVYMQFALSQTFASITWLPVWVMYAAGIFGMFGLAIRTFQVSIFPLISQKRSIKQ